MTYKVVLEIEIEADNPLEAAKKTQEWGREFDTDLQYYVQEPKSDIVYSVDLSEDDDEAVNEIDNYIPLIK